MRIYTIFEIVVEIKIKYGDGGGTIMLFSQEDRREKKCRQKKFNLFRRSKPIRGWAVKG